MKKIFTILTILTAVLLTTSCQKELPDSIKNVDVNQGGKTPTPTPEEKYVRASAESLSFTSPAGSLSFTISSNTSWSIKSDKDWCMVSSSSGSNNATLTVNVTENTSTSSRSATITISSTDAGSVKINVTQASVTPDLQLNKNNLSFTAAESNDSFTITSNISWSVTSDQTWCSVSTSSGSKNATVTVNVSENKSTSSRSATITVKAGGQSQIIAVTQAGVNAEYFWLGNTMPTSNNFPTLDGKEVAGIVTTYTSLAEAMEKASRVYTAGEYAVVMYPLSWGVEDDLVFLDSANKKYYVTKRKDVPDFPDYIYYESTEKIAANTTIKLSTKTDAEAAGATLYVKPEPTPTPVYPSTRTFSANGISFKMILVDGGTYTMGATSEQGSDAYDNEKPTHQVTLSSYYIGETEVTQELWQAVMGQKPTSDGSQWSSTYGLGGNYPAYYVSWNDCQDFIRRLNALTGENFRLPTEAEWEFAARGGNKSWGYKYAGSNNIDNVAWYYNNSYAKGENSSDYGTHNVATKSPNELGLYDMSGNVWEWCQDWYGDYSSGSQTNPTGPSSGLNRVGRGGSWVDFARNCRVSYRDYITPGYSDRYLGLRLALQ